MKILFLTNHLKGNDGWSRYSLEVIKELQKEGHQALCLVCQGAGQDEPKELSILKDPLKYLANPYLSWLTARKIEKIIKRFSPEIIHFIAEPYAAALPFLKKKNYKTVMTVHGTYANPLTLIQNPLKKKISKFLAKRYYQQIDQIITVSHYTKEYLSSKFLEPNRLFKVKEKIVVITNGVNLERYKIIDLDKKPVNKVKKILFVGAVKAKKGLGRAIEALKYYRDNFSDNFIYEIVGSYQSTDSYFNGLARVIRKYGLGGQIFFRGIISDEELENYYFQADLFLMLPVEVGGKFEGFGFVFLEANAKGIPVIGSRTSGCLEAIKDGFTGYLVDPNNPQAVAEKIDLVLNQNKIKPEDCLNWARQNSQKVKVKELVKIYRSLL